MALEMLDAYYGRGYDSRELFAGLKIENDSSFEEHLNRYDEINLNKQKNKTWGLPTRCGKFTRKVESNLQVRTLHIKK